MTQLHLAVMAELGDGSSSPERRHMWGNNSPWPMCVPRALTPLPLLSDRREVPGELLQPWGKHRLAHPSVPVTRRLNGL